MGRPRQFDETEAVAAAVSLFRDRGYAATSVDHLVEGMGVPRASLYNVFGSKRGLFLRVLDAVDTSDDATARVDVILVGLLEVAASDARVRAIVGDLLRTHAITDEQLGRRLVARAGLHHEERA